MALAGPTRSPKVTARAPSRPTSRAPAPRRFDRHALIDTLKILRQLGPRSGVTTADERSRGTDQRSHPRGVGWSRRTEPYNEFRPDDLSATASTAPGAAAR